MIDPTILATLVAMTDPADRQVAAAALAAELGAEALYAFVPDGELPNLIVPAPGFLEHIPPGNDWRALLERCGDEGTQLTVVSHPQAGRPVPALVCTRAQLTLVLVGGRVASADARLETLRQVMPLLAALLRKEQSERVLNARVRVARDTAKHASFLATTVDKTRAELERTMQAMAAQTASLEEAQAHAEQASRVKDEFLAMLGHELRNPLSPIVTALHILRMESRFTKEHEVIERQVGHLTRLVDDLLDVSRIAGGKVELVREHVELATVAARAREMAMPLFEQKQQTLRVSIPERGLLIDADPARMAQVFSNLLTNAARYSPAGAHVDFTAERQAEQVIVVVKDTGFGIEPKMLEVIFKRFVQAKQGADRADGGLGLGLAIVRSLTELHGGSVSAYSAGKNQGSQFTVTIPLYSGSLARRTPVVTRVSTVRRGRILVVDDNEDANELLCKALVARGHLVQSALDGPSALALAKAQPPELAILDMGLPVMDGYELALLLRAQPGSEQVRLVALTGYGQAEDKRKASAAGFDRHLVKPVPFETLERVMHELLA